MTEVCGRLVHLETPCLDANARPYFQDVLDHVRRVEAMVNSLRDVLTSVFEVSNLLEQQRQGAITRQLAAWAAILAVPTAIAGIYGMNFENMPELKTQYGYLYRRWHYRLALHSALPAVQTRSMAVIPVCK